jgi:3-dehydroshikimate dehydratase
VLVPGICSVTLRAQSPSEIVALAARAGLRTIEWGGDVHVPPGDLKLARSVRKQTTDAGLSVASYGSYFKAGAATPTEIEPTITTALELGAPRIRIWAGPWGTASATATGETRETVASSTRLIADAAAEAGLTVAFEFHGGTLTDDPQSTLELLKQVSRPNVSTYWQPPNSVPDDQVLAGLDLVLDQVAAAHVFSWWPEAVRHPLPCRETMWRQALERLVTLDRDVDLLLEFVPDDDPAQVGAAARTLLAWIDAAGSQR